MRWSLLSLKNWMDVENIDEKNRGEKLYKASRTVSE
jgi:hypothetical protein